MPLFWTITGLLTAAATAFVLIPLFRNRDTIPTVDRDTLNVEVIRQQLKELEDDLETGELEAAEYEKARADLEKELLYDLQGEGGGQHAGPSGRGRWVASVILIAVPALAFLLYWQLGAYPVVSQLQAGQAAANSEQHAAADQGLPSIEEMAAQLAQRLQQDPTNGEGWRMLGKTYSILKRYPEAAAALEKANALAEAKDPEVLADYAEALALAQGGGIAGKPAELLEAALALDPDNIKALWLTGYQAYQAQDVPRAVATWQRLAALFPPNSAEAIRIQQVIEEAQGEASPKGAVAPQQASSTSQGAERHPAGAATGKSLTLHVALADALRDQAAPQDTVFVFARAASGPRMPLAIVRRQVKDLPLDVVLDDSMAMSPAMNLSKFPQVSVEARISKSGNAMAQSGDLRGAVDSAAPGQPETIQVTIDTVVP